MKSNKNMILNICSLAVLVLGVGSNYIPMLRYVFVGAIVVLEWYLFRHADIFSNYEKGSAKWRTYRYLIVFSMLLIISIYCYSYFIAKEGVNEDRNSYLFLMLMLGVLGNLSPKIGFNRTLGLRLPWTLSNEDTWRYAHRMLGNCTFPCLMIMMLGYFLNRNEFMAIGVLLWVFVPAISSYQFNQRRKNDEKQTL